MQTIASLISDFEIAPELIVYGYGYCTTNRKSNSERYVAKVLKDWKQKGFATVAQVASYLDESDARNQDYRSVFRELGFYRNPTAEERRTMAAWFAKGFSLDDIIDACKKTVGISSPSIKYVDAVLNKTREEENKGDEAGSEKQESLAVRIQRLYEKTREENAKKTEENRMKVFTKHPELLKIETELKSDMLSLTSAMIRKDAAKIEKIRTKLSGLEAEKAKALSLAGYPENILDQIYTCSKCKDTGMLEDGNTCSCYYEKMQAVKQESK
jgi:DnaD/phage-associated family protein